MFREYATSMMINYACVRILSIDETEFPLDDTSYFEASHNYYGYSDLFQIFKGNSTESDPHSFDVSVTFRFIDNTDCASLWIRYTVGTLKDGVVSYLQKTCWYNLSETGRYYKIQYIDVNEYLASNPSSGDKANFINKVKSGDLVYICGDYTKLAEFIEFTEPYDPESTYTGAWYDKSKGVLYAKPFYCTTKDLDHQLHEWVANLPGRPGPSRIILGAPPFEAMAPVSSMQGQGEWNRGAEVMRSLRPLKRRLRPPGLILSGRPLGIRSRSGQAFTISLGVLPGLSV